MFDHDRSATSQRFCSGLAAVYRLVLRFWYMPDPIWVIQFSAGAALFGQGCSHQPSMPIT
jgi:hypothetical protein